MYTLTNWMLPIQINAHKTVSWYQHCFNVWWRGQQKRDNNRFTCKKPEENHPTEFHNQSRVGCHQCSLQFFKVCVHTKLPVCNAMYEIFVNTFFTGKFMCAPSFLVCAHLTSCARVHSLEGTLDATLSSRGGPLCHALHKSRFSTKYLVFLSLHNFLVLLWLVPFFLAIN